MGSEWAVSIRRACGLLMLDPKSFRYRSRRPDQAGLEKRIREICETRVRYGYKPPISLVNRDGAASPPSRGSVENSSFG